MTILRLTFENRGQSVLWWEIDDDTGRIVGCGPRDASVWASGRCSVDINTVAVGERPIFHGPATEPGGRFFNWKVAEIAPAKTGGGVASMTDLTPVVDLVPFEIRVLWAFALNTVDDLQPGAATNAAIEKLEAEGLLSPVGNVTPAGKVALRADKGR